VAREVETGEFEAVGPSPPGGWGSTWPGAGRRGAGNGRLHMVFNGRSAS